MGAESSDQKGNLHSGIVSWTSSGDAVSGRKAELCARADALTKAGDYATAAEIYNEIFQYGSDFSTLTNRGLCYLKLGRRDEAISDFRAAISAFPDHRELVTPLNNLGYALLEKGEHEEALPYLNRAVECDRTFAPAHFNRGVAHRAAGQTDEAIKDFEVFLSTTTHPRHSELIPVAKENIEQLKRQKSPEIQAAMMNLFGHTNVAEAMRQLDSIKKRS